MFENKLIALSYHSPNDFEYLDENVFRNFISWLENQKIRLYTVDDRQGLDQIDKPEWPTAFEKYLNDLEIRNLNVNTEREAQIEKLLSHAIRLEYSDNLDNLNFNPESQSSAQNNDQYDLLEKVDYSKDAFKNGLMRLQKMFSMVSKQNDNTSNLQAISLLIEENLRSELNKTKIKQVQANKKTEQFQLALNDIDLGFDTGNLALNDAAKILRLLHVKELRALQTQINETIVSIQNITANPKTDTSLGRVGR